MRCVLFSTVFLCFTIATCLAQEMSYEDAMRVTAKVEQEQRYVGSLSENDLHRLPVGIVKQVGASRYVIAIDSAIFTPETAFFHAYMAVEFPGTGKHIAFGARRIPFNTKGVLGGSGSRLILLSEHTIPLGPKSEMILPSNGSNYVEWDCNGFVAMQLSGKIAFASGLLQPQLEEQEEVLASFSARAEDINALIVSVSMDPFRIKGMKDWTFEVQDAVFDWNVNSDHPEMRFPLGMTGTPGMWTGTYIRTVRVTMPEEFSSGEGSRTQFTAHNLLIDDSGVSAMLQVEHIAQGLNMSGWEFGVDELGVQILQNEVTGGHLRGKIRLPVMDSAQAIVYEAMLQFDPIGGECNYSFSAAPMEDVSFAVFAAKADIFSTSRIQVSRVNGRFMPEALLNGRIRFEQERIHTAQLQMQNLKIIHEAPFVTSGTIAYTGNAQHQAAGYPVSLDSILFRCSPTGPYVELKVMLNLAESSNNGISVATRLQIRSKMQDQKLKFDRVDIGAIQLAAHSQAFTLDGSLYFYDDDPVYGKGFFGGVSLRIKDVLEPGVSVGACFGRTDFRYFAVDAAVPVRFPIGGTGIVVERLIGGVSSRMRPQRQQLSQVNSLLQGTLPPPGMTQTYFPDAQSGLNFKAGATIVYGPSEKTLNGDVMFEVMFNPHGGIETVSFNGFAYFMSTIQERKTLPAPVMGSMQLAYNVPSRSFDAQVQAQMNVQQTLTGTAVSRIHFDPDSWSVCIGRPSQPAQVSVVPFASAQAYFMAGDGLEPMLAPPSQVVTLVNQNGLDQLRDASALSEARGMAAGMRIQGGMYKEFGWDVFSVYGSFGYGAGFDMMLVDYGPTAICSATGAAAGINGKIAEGQLFAYMQGNVGARGSVGNKDFDVVLLSGSFAALLQGRLPRPSWLSGGMMVQYEILSLISGQFRLDFETGQLCTIVVQ